MGRGANTYIRKADKESILNVICCLYCGSSENLHIEHIVPIAKGGTSEISNLTRACQRCNSYKGTFYIMDFFFRMLAKRTDCQEKLYSYLFRLRRARKRNKFKNENLEKWLIDKINTTRMDHKYFTKVIQSLMNKEYLPYN